MISSFLRKQLAICFCLVLCNPTLIYITRSQLGIKSSGRDAFSCWATSRGASATRAEAKRALSLSLSLTLGLAMATWEQWWTGGSKGRHSLSTSKGGQTSACPSTKQHLHKIYFFHQNQSLYQHVVSMFHAKNLKRSWSAKLMLMMSRIKRNDLFLPSNFL